ncbi:MAG: hypothetical protein AAF561_16120, partial [Planctomycetota bacterium]
EVVDEWLALRPDAIAVSARTGAGLERLLERVYGSVQGTRSDVRLKVDVRDGKLLAKLEREARINSRDYDGDDVALHATVGRRLLGELRRDPDARIAEVTPAT